MADNRSIRDADNVAFNAATDELADGSHAPKVQLLDGTTGGTPISPATSGNQSTLNTNIGATNESAAASDTATSGLNGLFKRLLQRFTTFLALLPASLGTKTASASLAVTLASDEALLGVQKRARTFTRIQAAVTRPANTTAYAIGDAVGPAAGSAVFTFAGAAASAGGQGSVRGAIMTRNNTSLTNASFRMDLFQATPTGAPANDNDAYAATYHSDRNNYVGYITFDAGRAGGGNGSVHEATLSRSELFFDITSTNVDLVGVLVAQAAYTPTSGEVFTITLDIEQGK